MSVILIIPKKADQHYRSTSMVFSRMNDRIKSAKEIIYGTREISEDILELKTQNAKLQQELNSRPQWISVEDGEPEQGKHYWHTHVKTDGTYTPIYRGVYLKSIKKMDGGKGTMSFTHYAESNAPLPPTQGGSIMTPEDFKAQYLGDFTIDQREIDLLERLEKYYRDTPDSMDNRTAKPHWSAFILWCERNGYTREEINKIKRMARI